MCPWPPQGGTLRRPHSSLPPSGPTPAVGPVTTSTRARLRTLTPTTWPTSSASALTVSLCPWPPGGGHFASPTFQLSAFGANAGGWSSDNTYPRQLADVNADGRADIIGFSSAGVYESLATAGGHF